MSDAPRLSIAAPCYNEAEGIGEVLREWDAALDELDGPSEIVLCDDGSTDGTGRVLAALRDRFPRLRVVSHEVNGGYGRALSSAIDATRGEFVATIDSDGQFLVEDAIELLDVLEREDLDGVTGYRRRKRDTAVRVLADRTLNLIVRALFGLRLRDTNCALKVARGELLRGLLIEARGYPTPTEVCVRLTALGHRLGEAPVRHRARTAGTSKLRTFRTGWTMFRFLLYLRRRLALYRSGIIREP